MKVEVKMKLSLIEKIKVKIFLEDKGISPFIKQNFNFWTESGVSLERNSKSLV